MKISGHKTRKIFDRCNIGKPDDLRQIAKKIGAYYDMVTNPVIIADNSIIEENSHHSQLVGINK